MHGPTLIMYDIPYTVDVGRNSRDKRHQLTSLVQIQHGVVSLGRLLISSNSTGKEQGQKLSVGRRESIIEIRMD